MAEREFHLLRDLVSLRKFCKSFAVEADDTDGIARKITRGA